MVGIGGKTLLVSPGWLAPFEVTEVQAHRWGKAELGETLDELKQGIDEKLADLRAHLDEAARTPVAADTSVTPAVVPALLALLRRLPGVVGNSLSGDPQRVGAAKAVMAGLQRQLGDAGVHLDERFTGFPERLADLRQKGSQS